MSYTLSILCQDLRFLCFFTDFCAHICNHFYSNHQETPDVNEKIKESLRAYGPPILQGAISTVLAVIPMFWVPSYILLTFSKMVLLVIVEGALHGLIILPAIMAIEAAIANFCRKTV